MLTKYYYDLDAASSQFRGGGQSFSFWGIAPPLCPSLATGLSRLQLDARNLSLERRPRHLVHRAGYTRSRQELV